MSVTPTSFRLKPGTLAQLDRLSALLDLRQRRDRERTATMSGVVAVDGRRTTRADALAVAVADTLARLEHELDLSAVPSDPHRAAATAGRGLLGDLGGRSLAAELMAERRAAAADEGARERDAATGHA